MTPKEKLSISLYETYNIAEWSEKSCVLTPEEQMRLLEELKSGVDSDLTVLTRMPFPTFIETYYSAFRAYQEYSYDPAFPYKVFFLSPDDLRYFTERLRTPEKRRAAILEEYHLPKSTYTNGMMPFLLQTSLEDIPRTMSSNRRNRNYEIKFAYLTQYIDASEAKRLGLSLAEVFSKDGADGYDLEGKMRLLNPALATIFTHYLGLYGHNRMNKKEISKSLNFYCDPDNILAPSNIALEAIEIIFPYFMRPTGELKNFLGVRDHYSSKKSILEYANRTIRNLDIALEIRYIVNNLPLADRLIISRHEESEVRLYIAAKYLYKDTASLARNLVVTPVRAEQMLNKVK